MKTFDELTFTDDFIFGEVMKDKVICKEFIELILKIKISNITFLHSQEKIKVAPNLKSVVLDIYLKDDDKIINVEMQTTNKNDLPERARYYQAIIDIENMPSGTNYKSLFSSYIIFLCTFDPYKLGFPYYDFDTSCTSYRHLLFGDRAFKLVVNLAYEERLNLSLTGKYKGMRKLTLDSEQKAFYDYIARGKVSSEFTKKLDDKIKSIKSNKEMRDGYMTLQRKILEEKFEAQTLGIAKGMRQGAYDKAIETARNMLLYGISEYIIAKCTGLSLDEVERIKSNSL